MSLPHESVPVTAPLPPHLDGLTRDLRSPDPAVRDEGAFSTLARLQGQGGLDAHLAGLGERGLALLQDGEVQARSFGALLIALVAERDRVTGGAGEEEVRRWLAGVELWYAAEPDTRGWDDRLGWLHAVAHGADAVGELAGSPRFGRDEVSRLLHLLVDRATAATATHWQQGEDDRVAVAVMAVLRRDLLTASEVRSAVEKLASGWSSMPPGPVTATADNCVRMARALHLQLSLGVRPEPGAAVVHPAVREEALRAVGAALADMHWFYGTP